MSPCESYLLLQRRKLLVTFTDAHSLCITVINHAVSSIMSHKVSTKVHALRTVVCPPHSRRFVEGLVPRSFSGLTAFLTGENDSLIVPRSLVSVDKRCFSVWVVNTNSRPKDKKNGACLVEVSEVDAVVAVGDDDGYRQGSDSDEVPVVKQVESVEESNELDEFNDEFDEYYGTLDLGYKD